MYEKQQLTNSVVQIESVSREKNVFIHSGLVNQGIIQLGDRFVGQVDKLSRRRAQANHTATHLLQSALKSVIDPSVGQRGSLVAFDRLRFDFNCSRPLDSDELNNIENLVNGWITEDHPIIVNTMPIDEALAAGALAMFGEKYGEIVRVIDVPGVSMELCGGTHVETTSELGLFKVISESGVASGIRRVEAVAGLAALEYLNEREAIVRQLSELFKSQSHEIVSRVLALQKEVKEKNKELAVVRESMALAKVHAYLGQTTTIGNSQVIVERLDDVDGSSMQSAAQDLIQRLGDQSAIIFGGLPESSNLSKVIFVAAFGQKLIEQGLQAGKFIGPLSKICGGGGGGRPHLAQAGGRDGTKLQEALDFAKKELENFLS